MGMHLCLIKWLAGKAGKSNKNFVKLGFIKCRLKK